MDPRQAIVPPATPSKLNAIHLVLQFDFCPRRWNCVFYPPRVYLWFNILRNSISNSENLSIVGTIMIVELPSCFVPLRNGVIEHIADPEGLTIQHLKLGWDSKPLAKDGNSIKVGSCEESHRWINICMSRLLATTGLA